MGILRSIVQSLVLSMLHTLEYLFFRCFVAFEFIGDDHAWGEALLLEQFALKTGSGKYVVIASSSL